MELKYEITFEIGKKQLITAKTITELKQKIERKAKKSKGKLIIVYSAVFVEFTHS